MVATLEGLQHRGNKPSTQSHRKYSSPCRDHCQASALAKWPNAERACVLVKMPMKDRIQSLYPSGYLAKSKITPEHAVFAISLPCRQLRKSQIVNSCSNPLLVFFLLHSSMLLIFLLRTYAHDWLGQDIICPINCILPALRASTGEPSREFFSA